MVRHTQVSSKWYSLLFLAEKVRTGFDVECRSTLYIDKPMKAHTLMQAIGRANRRYPGKDFGLVVDVAALDDAIAEVEGFLRALGFEPSRLIGAKGWVR